MQKKYAVCVWGQLRAVETIITNLHIFYIYNLI